MNKNDVVNTYKKAETDKTHTSRIRMNGDELYLGYGEDGRKYGDLKVGLGLSLALGLGVGGAVAGIVASLLATYAAVKTAAATQDHDATDADQTAEDERYDDSENFHIVTADLWGGSVAAGLLCFILLELSRQELKKIGNNDAPGKPKLKKVLGFLNMLPTGTTLGTADGADQSFIRFSEAKKKVIEIVCDRVVIEFDGAADEMVLQAKTVFINGELKCKDKISHEFFEVEKPLSLRRARRPQPAITEER